MAQLRSIGGSGEAAGDDEVSAQVRFSPETGQIWVGEQRMLLVHAEAQASLRKELIDSLGATRTRGLFTRMGYASGVHDAELARKRAQGVADRELFLSGLRLHTIEGMV